MHGENALSAQRRILHLTLVDPRRAELDYQDLIAAEPGADPASKTGTPGAVNRITTDGMFTGFSDAKLDQFWADFTEQRALVLTVPSMSAASRDQLLRLGAQAELELGCSVAVSVRETA